MLRCKADISLTKQRMPINTYMKIDEAQTQNRHIAGYRENARQQRRAYNLPSCTPEQRNALIAAFRNMVHRYGSFVQFGVTLQSNFIPGETNGYLDWQISRMKEQFRHVCNRVNGAIYGNGFKRKPDQYRLMMLPVIQGTPFSPFGKRTLHYHMGLGNVPDEYGSQALRQLFRESWTMSPAARDDVDVKPADPGWTCYITGEMEDGVVAHLDIDNWFVPSKIDALLT
jgi:hypothetical protein